MKGSICSDPNNLFCSTLPRKECPDSLLIALLLVFSSACSESKIGEIVGGGSGEEEQAQSAQDVAGNPVVVATAESRSQGGSSRSSSLNTQNLTMNVSTAAVADGLSEIEVSFYFENSNGEPVRGITPEVEVDLGAVENSPRFLSLGKSLVGRLRNWVTSEPSPVPSSIPTSAADVTECLPSNHAGVAKCWIVSTRSGQVAVNLTKPVAKEFDEGLTFVHGPAIQAVILDGPSDANAIDGFSESITVEIQDAFGNRVDTGPDAVAPLTVMSTLEGDRVDGTLTLQASGGRAVFSGLAYRTAGEEKKLRVKKESTRGQSTTRSVTIKEGLVHELPIQGAPEVQVESPPFAVESGPLHQLEIAEAPSEVVAGQPVPVAVVAKDLFGNLVRGFVDPVEVTTNDPIAQTPGAVQFSALDQGRKTLSQGVSLRTSGQRVIRVKHPQTGIEVISAPIRVHPGEVSAENSQVLPSKLTVNADGSDESLIEVILRDAFGNAVEGAPIAVGSSRVGGDIVIGSDSTSDSSGMVRVRVRSQSPGVSRFNVQSGAKPISTEKEIEFLAHPVLRFAVAPSSSGVLGVALTQQPQVIVGDENGQLRAGISGSIVLEAYNDSQCSNLRSGAVLQGSASIHQSRAIFSGLALQGGLGIVYLKASLAGATSACSGAIQLTGRLAFTAQPSQAGRGSVFPSGVRVALQDGVGGSLSAQSASVSLTAHSGSDSNCSGAPVAGTLTSSSATASQGVAEFSTLAFDTSGEIRLKATAPGYSEACSSPILVAESFIAPASFCDEGTPGTTCIIRSAKTISSNAAMEIRVNRLQINSGGSIVGFTDRTNKTCLVIQATDGVDVLSGGSITVSGKGFTTAPLISRNSWAPQEWGAGAYGGAGGGCVQIVTPGTLALAGSIQAAGGGSSQGGSVWIDAVELKGAGSITAAGGAGARGSSSTNSATACNNGRGNPGGNGGAVKIDAVTTGYSGAVTVAGGAGGAAGTHGFRCSSPAHSGTAASGTPGTYIRFNKVDLLVPSGATIVMTDSIKSILQTVRVQTEGKLITRVGESLNLTSLVTEASSTFENHGSVTVAGATLSGGRIDNRFGEITVTGDALVTAATEFLGELGVNGSLSVDSTLQGIRMDPVVPLTVTAGSITVAAGAAISTDGSSNAIPLNLEVAGNLHVLGRVSANGQSGAGGSAASVTIDLGSLTGNGTISATGGDGRRGNEGARSSTDCSNGPGSPGGAGGAIVVSGNLSGYTGTYVYSGGLGGLAGLTGYRCSSPRYSGRAASGVSGSLLLNP